MPEGVVTKKEEGTETVTKQEPEDNYAPSPAAETKTTSGLLVGPPASKDIRLKATAPGTPYAVEAGPCARVAIRGH